MPLAKTAISWPISGALDTKRSPLSMQPGSHLTLDNLIQERLNEWRRRNGTTQVAADTTPMAAAPFSVATWSSGGIVASDHNRSALYSPTPTSGRWKQATRSVGVDDLSNVKVARSLSSLSRVNAVASDGTSIICVRSSGVPGAGFVVSLMDSAGNVLQDSATSLSTLPGTGRMARCAAMTRYLCAFQSRSNGSLYAVVADTTLGTVGAPVSIKTGLETTVGNIDAHYYSGSTITIVARMAGSNQCRVMEFNPATGALAVDQVAFVEFCDSALSLLMNPGSTTRLVASSTAGSTRITSVDSSGFAVSNDQVEAVASTQITGCGTNTTDWAAVYQTATAVRRNARIAGVVGSPGNINGITTFGPTAGAVTLDGQGWGEPGEALWYCILGNHSLTVGDPNDTLIMVANGYAAGDTTMTPVSTITPLQGPVQPSAGGGLIQAQRTGTRTFAFSASVLSHYAPDSTAATNADYEIFSFTHKLLTASEIATRNVGPPVTCGGLPVFPGNFLRTPDSVNVLPIGLASPPRMPLGLTQATIGGTALDLLSTYQYCFVVETEDASGRIWRSPPSVPASITLTGANDQVSNVTYSHWQTGSLDQYFRIKIYRTLGNGSVFHLLFATQAGSAGSLFTGGDWSFTDGAPDSLLLAAEILYSTGEQPNICWPPSSHAFVHDDRLWAINRDFRTEVQYSKNIRPNRQPETTDANALDLDDEFGDLTGGCSIEGRGILFKRNAIYFIQGEGLTDAGSGQNYTVTRVSQDVGAVAGSPIVVAGDTVYFVSERGVYSISIEGEVQFAGAAIDQYLSQPLVQTPETIFDGCFVPLANEVRFVTTNYILVFNRTFQTWTRWTGLAGMKRCLVINGRMVLFKGSDGTVWREGDHTQLTDQGAAFSGIIRSAWIRAAGEFGQFALWRTLATATRTSGGGSIAPTMQVFTDDSDTQAQAWTAPAIPGATAVVHMEARLAVKNVSAFSVQVTLPSGDDTFRIEKIGAEVGIRRGAQKRPSSERWA